MFTSHRELLEKAHSTLLKASPPSPELGWLVSSGLHCMLHSTTFFDAHVNHGASFTKHFLELLTSVPFKDEGDWFGLFEDIALFVREKKLRTPCASLDVAEARILDYFESSEQWAPEDGHIVSLWYWYRLPLCVLQENQLTEASA